MRGDVTVALLLLIASCGEGDDGPKATDPEGAFSFSLAEEPEQQLEQDRRVAWQLRSGVRVTAQRLPVTDSVVRERSVGDVADAIARRYSLGEVEGDMTAAPCHTSVERTHCLVGWLALPESDGGARYEKRGVVVQAGDEILVLEVMGPVGETEQVEHQAELLERTLVIGEG